MATVVNIQISIGQSAEFLSRVPTVTDSGSPYISWTLPEGISQKRYSIRIINQEGLIGEYYSGAVSSTLQFHQYPLGSPMNENFRGLLMIEIAISEETSGEFEYSSGEKYYVYDTDMERLYNAVDTNLQWQDSTDPNFGQNLIYNLVVSRDPTFTDPFDEEVDVDISDTGGSFNRYIANLDSGQAYFWKVRAHDGLDYGPWTITHGFWNYLNYPPEVEIINVLPLNNDYGDVVITVVTNDLDLENISIRFTYTGGTAGETKTVMRFINPVVLVPNGTHTLIWRSGRNEKLIEADDYLIYATGYDRIGYGVEDVYGPFSMDNSRIGGSTGGLGAVDIEFPIQGYVANIIEGDTSELPFPLVGNIRKDKQDYDGHNFDLESSIKSWSIYSQGLVTDNYQYYVRYRPGLASWKHWEEKGVGDPFNWPYNYWNRLHSPLGTIFANHHTYYANDLDSGDPNFTGTLDYVGSDGWHIEVDEKRWGYTGRRYGFVRFLKNDITDRTNCPDCGGKGWQVGELIDLGGGKYKRQPCSTCNGSRFSDVPLTSPIRYSYTDYKPIEDWIQPLGKDFMSAMKVVSADLLRGKQFIWGSPNRAEDEWPKPLPEYENFKETFFQIDGGHYPHMECRGWMAKKNYTNLPDENHQFPLISGIGSKSIKTVERAPVVGYMRETKLDYVTGYSPSEAPGFYNRPEPTHKWERGMFYLSGSLTTIQPLEPLKIIYLQSGWDRYNTIHWQATISTTSRIHLQVAKFFEDGTHTEYSDVLSDGVEYFEDVDAYMVKPNVWHTYWDIVSAQFLEEGFDYRLRIRQFDIVSQTFSQWVYSQKFLVDRYATNPPNIISTEYEKWSRVLYITFRLDDTQSDAYDITNMWYSVDGNVFKTIQNADIIGEKYNLLSSTTGVEHVIGWKTGSYQLEPGDEYRVRIEVIPSALAAGFTPPYFNWSCDNNYLLRYAELNLMAITGKAQEFIYNAETEQFEETSVPTPFPGRIDVVEDELDALMLSPAPSGKWNFYDPPHASASGVLVDPSGYLLWQSEQIIPGITRAQLMSDKASELNQLRNIELVYWMGERDKAERDIRKNLIKQGFYCNGYIGNDENNGVFRFRVESQPPYDQMFTGQDYDPQFDTRYEVYYRFQMDFFTSFDSQEHGPLRDLFYRKDGDKIQGANVGRTTILLPEGEVETDIVDYDDRWGSFGDGEGQPWDNALNGEGGIYNVTDSEGPDYYNPHAAFTIPREDLPGEWNKYYKNTSFPSVTDALPSGIASFDTTYRWRVAAYNIVTDTRREIVRPVIDSITTYPGIKATVNFTLYGDESISTAEFYAGHNSPKNNFYYSVDTKTPTWENIVQVSFPTDRPAASGFREQTFENPTIWTPWGYDRSRPSVMITSDHQYLMWYSKNDSFDQPTVLSAMGKNPEVFGEYAQLFPENPTVPVSRFNGESAIYAPFVTNVGGVYKMWVTMFNGTSNRIAYSESIDNETWSTPSLVTGVSTGYSQCLVYDGEFYHMWYGDTDGGVSKIFYAISSDGQSFSLQNSGNPVYQDTYSVTSPWVIMEGSSYRMYFTKYDGLGVSKIYSATSTDGITWTGEAVEIDVDNTLNPCVVQDVWEGYPLYRIYYNQITGADTRIKTSILNDRVWISNIVYNKWFGGSISYMQGDYGTLDVSKFGNSYTLDIINLPNAYNASDLKVRLPFTCTDTTRDYLVQSAWLTPDVAEDYNADMSPEKFDYNFEIKNLRFNGGF